MRAICHHSKRSIAKLCPLNDPPSGLVWIQLWNTSMEIHASPIGEMLELLEGNPSHAIEDLRPGFVWIDCYAMIELEALQCLTARRQ